MGSCCQLMELWEQVSSLHGMREDRTRINRVFSKTCGNYPIAVQTRGNLESVLTTWQMENAKMGKAGGMRLWAPG